MPAVGSPLRGRANLSEEAERELWVSLPYVFYVVGHMLGLRLRQGLRSRDGRGSKGNRMLPFYRTACGEIGVMIML